MELIHGSETSANYILTPGKYPKEHIQYSNHGESLKSRIKYSFNDASEGDQHLYWHVGLVFLCSSRIPEDGTAVLKHVGI
jgi:hypothetical protein